ncbi:MAG: GNAT family N-acetyltransferase [Theionarchaea archaeon]|nr:GNAT family N-acetyltransferase [Theionarchaea archaeon]
MMEHKAYQKVFSLFKGKHLNLVIQAAAQGNQPTQIWVDDCVNPQTAFMWSKTNCYYLVGNEKNKEFNKAVKEYIAKKIAPEAVEKDFSVFKVYYTEGWEHKIYEIFDRPLVKMGRQFYAFSYVPVDWKNENNESNVPSGSSVEYIDQKFLNRNLRNTEYVVEEIESMWNSLDDFLSNGFGFCAVYNGEIVCWCTAEYVSDTQCGIGIETLKKYQNKGFATVTASALVEHCISKGIVPHWDSWSDNLPSVRVAEKVGFKKIEDYFVYFGSLNDSENFCIQGNHYFEQKRYKKAAQWYEKALTIKKSSKSYYHAACAWALAGENDAALTNLRKAKDAEIMEHQ